VPEAKCNPCVVCGKEAYPPAEYFEGGYSVICYRDAGDHSLMIHGRTAEEAVERWNRLNPLPGEQVLTVKLTFPAIIRALLGIRR
jgi:hypothetical protein